MWKKVFKMSKPVRRKHIDIGSHTGYSICIKAYTYKNNLYNTTVKPILRGHLSDKEKGGIIRQVTS